jgi:hypothetical protein
LLKTLPPPAYAGLIVVVERESIKQMAAPTKILAYFIGCTNG